MPTDTPARALAERIIDDHLDELATGKIETLKTKLTAEPEAVDAAIVLLRNLSPRPGAAVATNDTEYVIPDVLVVRRGDRWVVELNPDLAPRLRINPYYAELARKPANADDGACMRDHLQEARWFLRSLQNRALTLLRVAGFMVEHQREWLDRGDMAMKPLVLRDIADALEMHESTISRVTANKYLHTPRGVFEFRHFFSAQLGAVDGGTSATAVRAQIRRILADEDSLKPFSDGRIAELLAERGIQVARRTVAKYREGMSIPPAATRRRAN
jgi:RNA polymerase sigma-54 factor